MESSTYLFIQITQLYKQTVSIFKFCEFSKTYYELSYYIRGGPVYLLIGGEDEVDPAGLQTGYFHDHGKENNAKLFLVEHRFYGKSQPLK